MENTRQKRIFKSLSKDHLHIRGEYLTWSRRWCVVLGSSPHTWRIQGRSSSLNVFYRIISTYVENTTGKSVSQYTPLGSSPHTWRIPLTLVLVHIRLRIISTYVENTEKVRCLRTKIQDHLHIRGEYELGYMLNDVRIGSSPHTWRIQAHFFKVWTKFRIISTYVENTIKFLRCYILVWDHLHIRGEYG